MQCFWFLLCCLTVQWVAADPCDVLLLSHKAALKKHPLPQPSPRKQGQGWSLLLWDWLSVADTDKLILEVKEPLGLKIPFSLETLAFTGSQT